jgi:hypothetical protein
VKFWFFLIHKNSYTGPLHITDLEYGGYDKEIQSFGQFLTQTDDFWQNRRLTPKDFGKKFEILKTRKNSYMGSLCKTDLEYESYDHEIQSSGQFLSQTDDFC